MSEDINENEELTPEQEKRGMGCLFSIVLMIIAVIGINWFSDPPYIEIDEIVIGGESQSWNLHTNVESINGLYNLESHLLYLLVDGDSMVLESEQKGFKSWDFQMINDLDIEVITIKGIPIETGREDVIMRLKYTSPIDTTLLGKEGYIGLQATINYPSFNFGDAVLGSISGQIDVKNEELIIDEKFPMVIIKERAKFELWMLKEKIFTGLIFLSFFYGVYQLIMLIRSYKKAENS